MENQNEHIALIKFNTIDKIINLKEISCINEDLKY